MNQCLDALEKFLHQGASDFPPLVQAALIHAQFESIHPFLDGNGRLGRLLIALLLIERKVITEPLLYPSLYLKQNRSRYYELLQEVRFQGNWEEWVTFFLDAIAATAEQAVDLAKTVLDLFDQDGRKVAASGIRRGSIDRVYRQFQQTPIMQVSTTVRTTELSLPTVIRTLDDLARLGILREITGRERNRVYRYEQYVSLLNEGTEL
jgi:Fic family protein